MANGTNECFLPYHVRILAPGERAWKDSAPADCWSAVWVGREYRQLHQAPIPLERKPQDRVLRACAFTPTRRSASVDQREDGSVSVVWLYNDGCNPRYEAKHWTDYAKRLDKLLRHLKPDFDKCARGGDPCQPYFPGEE